MRGAMQRQERAGFSLFEIVIAMAILALISGTVLSILWQAGDTAAEIREWDRRDEELSVFLSLLEETIEGLPNTGSITMTPPNESASGFHEMTVSDAATAFAFGERIGSIGETTIALRPATDERSGESLFELALSRDDFAPNDEDGDGMVFRAGEDDFLDQDEEGRYWLPLVSGVESASWRFWDEEQREWLDEWTDEERLPALMEFAIDDLYRPVPLRVVFEVPLHLSDPEAAAEIETPEPAATTSTTSAVSRGGATARGDGDGGRDGAGRRGAGGRGGDGRSGDGGRRGDGGGRRSSGGDGAPRGGTPGSSGRGQVPGGGGGAGR